MSLSKYASRGIKFQNNLHPPPLSFPEELRPIGLEKNGKGKQKSNWEKREGFHIPHPSFISSSQPNREKSKETKKLKTKKRN